MSVLLKYHPLTTLKNEPSKTCERIPDIAYAGHIYPDMITFEVVIYIQKILQVKVRINF